MGAAMDDSLSILAEHIMMSGSFDSGGVEALQAMESWPLALRAIFDPRAGVELAKRERQARLEAEERWAGMRAKYGQEIPF